MTFSTFDIVTVSSDIEQLHALLTKALERDADGKYTVTHEEAAALGDLIVQISQKITKST